MTFDEDVVEGPAPVIHADAGVKKPTIWTSGQ
jgi:hypothetical protein